MDGTEAALVGQAQEASVPKDDASPGRGSPASSDVSSTPASPPEVTTYSTTYIWLLVVAVVLSRSFDQAREVGSACENPRLTLSNRCYTIA
jgi:hypothetical protein